MKLFIPIEIDISTLKLSVFNKNIKYSDLFVGGCFGCTVSSCSMHSTPGYKVPRSFNPTFHCYRKRIYII